MNTVSEMGEKMKDVTIAFPIDQLENYSKLEDWMAASTSTSLCLNTTNK